MPRLAFVADIHVGNHRLLGGTTELGMNERCRETIAVLRRAVTRAEAVDCAAFVILGDLFDTTKPSPQMIKAVRDALYTRTMRVYIIAGNHDRESGERGDHALGPLDDTDRITVIEEPRLVTNLWMVPYRAGPASVWLPADLGGLIDDQGAPMKEDAIHNVLCTHVGLKRGNEPEFLAQAHDSISAKTLGQACAEFRIGHVIAGNWHWRSIWQDQSGVTMMQCGTLVPTGWDNPGLLGHGTVAVFDTQSASWDYEEIPGPRFVSAVGLEAGLFLQKELVAAKEKGFIPYLRWTVPQEEISLAQIAIENWGIKGYIVPDSGEAKAAARTAAFSAKSATTLDQALKGYIDAMDLNQGVEPDQVFNTCKEFLAGKGTGT